MKDHYVDRFGTHSHIWFALLKGISVFRKTQLSMAATNSSSLNSWIDSRPLGHPKLKCVHLSLGKCKDKDSVPSTDICKRFVSWERKCRRHHRHQTDEKCKSQDIDVLYIYICILYTHISSRFALRASCGEPASIWRPSQTPHLPHATKWSHPICMEPLRYIEALICSDYKWHWQLKVKNQSQKTVIVIAL